MMIYLSTTHDPFINLALEQYLFKTENFPALFLYQNTESVIIGRAQNPWVECDIQFLREQCIPLVRRQSGGGTVFHDLGNLNFTFFSDKSQYDKTKNLKLIIKALATLGAEIRMNERHDLMLRGKKISGSAFRETRNHAFHHGTLLVHSNLDVLRRSLQAPNMDIKSKGVASVKSSVINLQEIYPHLNMQQVIDALINTFSKEHHEALVKTIEPPPELQELISIYQSNAWRFEKTLPFTHTLNDGSILHVESGVIINIESQNQDVLTWLNKPYIDFFSQ